MNLHANIMLSSHRISKESNPAVQQYKHKKRKKHTRGDDMRHPAAPTIIAILLGFLAFMVVWARWRGDGHHEGNPHPNDVPAKMAQKEEPKRPSSRSSNEGKEDLAGAGGAGGHNAARR
jgi:hypothetical protein